MYYTYILKSASAGKLYIGHTEDIERRIFEHNSNQSKSARNKGPWELIFKKKFSGRSEAMIFENKLKKIKNPKYLLTHLNEISE
ncbi:MAG: GIY-YIG nuclease family protein [Ignavibacteria bacterium]|nr:GIY-YIG nuclease family protein [Ignavibacteria bacterium]